MRVILTIMLAGTLCLPFAGQAQNMHGIGIHFGAYDFYGPQKNSYFTNDRYTYAYNESKNGFDTIIKSRFFLKPMVKFSYWWNVGPHFDINTSLSLANLEYPTSNSDTAFTQKYTYDLGGVKNEQLLTELDLRVNYNILSRASYIVSPYVFFGVNASYHDLYFGADIPLGLGFNIAINKQKSLMLNLESAYKITATDHDVNHLQHSAGFVYWFTPGYRVPKAEPTTVMADTMAMAAVGDSDNDGLNDNEDQCPTIAGPAQFNGCPDTDGDGISDKDDTCPLVAGLAQFSGCPDTDGDGIPDNTDKCPYVAGTAERDGCPVPDKDGDGFTDNVDKCPDTYSKTNSGCPEIRKEIITQVEKAAKAIFFETGKATIKNISFKSLDAVVAVLKSDPSLYADIEGHTDNVQPKTYTNMELSQKRAEAVREYFISKGIAPDRLTAQGFGETQPVADNATPAGKAQNRRTVIKLRNYSK